MFLFGNVEVTAGVTMGVCCPSAEIVVSMAVKI